MKKKLYYMLLLATMTACNNAEKPKEEVSQEVEQKTEKIEEANQESEKFIKDSEYEFNATQSEIDSLLNDI